MTTNNYSINQIVKGIAAGTFIILGFRTLNGETLVGLKAVNPANHDEMAHGELTLPISAIRPL